jgi:hypothetical protein
MGTFNSKEIIADMMRREGVSPDGDPRFDVEKIVEYVTPEGATVWGVVYICEVPMGLGERYDNPTEYILRPHTIWTRIP